MERPRTGELGLKSKAGVAAPVGVRVREMGGVNAAIEVGKHKLDVRG
jgi:hypothetical protein